MSLQRLSGMSLRCTVWTEPGHLHGERGQLPELLAKVLPGFGLPLLASAGGPDPDLISNRATNRRFLRRSVLVNPASPFPRAPHRKPLPAPTRSGGPGAGRGPADLLRNATEMDQTSNVLLQNGTEMLQTLAVLLRNGAEMVRDVASLEHFGGRMLHSAGKVVHFGGRMGNRIRLSADVRDAPGRGAGGARAQSPLCAARGGFSRTRPRNASPALPPPASPASPGTMPFIGGGGRGRCGPLPGPFVR